jgi:hypothetical protein
MRYHLQHEENNFPKALGISTLVMASLLLIGFFVVFKAQVPDEYGMGGMIVNYGTSPEGMGDDYMSVEEPSVDPNANNERPDHIDPVETPTPTPTQQVAEKAVVTQDLEDAPAVTKTEKKVVSKAAETTKEVKEVAPKANAKALFKRQ